MSQNYPILNRAASGVIDGLNLGTASGVFKQKNIEDVLEFRTLVPGFSVGINQSAIELEIFNKNIPILTDNDKIIYVGKHGDDANNGLTLNNAVLTFTQADVLIVAESPDVNNKWTIVCLDAGIYNEGSHQVGENIDFVNYFCPNATLINTNASTAILAGNNTSFIFHTVANISAGGHCFLADSTNTDPTFFKANVVSPSGQAHGIRNTASDFNATLILDINKIIAGTAKNGIHMNSTSPIVGYVGQIDLMGAGAVGIGPSNGATVSLNVGSISGVVGNAIVMVSAGTILNLDVGNIDCDTGSAMIVNAGTTLNLRAGSVRGARTIAGTFTEYSSPFAKIKDLEIDNGSASGIFNDISQWNITPSGRLTSRTTNSKFITIASGTTPANVNLSEGHNFKVTLGQDMTFNFHNPVDGERYLFYVNQDAVGGRAITWPSNALFPSGRAEVITSSGLARDIYTCFYDLADDVYLGGLTQSFF